MLSQFVSLRSSDHLKVILPKISAYGEIPWSKLASAVTGQLLQFLHELPTGERPLNIPTTM
jgi:hypothetical protein